MKSTYKAVEVYEPGKFRVVERQVSEPGAGQVRIRVEACGICHTDAATVMGVYPGLTLPRVPGHEVVGRIEGLGAGVSRWKIVATYSSTRGTGARLTVSVFTGSGRAAGSLASVLLHPEVVSTSTPTNAKSKMTESFFNLTFLPNTGAEIEMPPAQSRIHHMYR